MNPYLDQLHPYSFEKLNQLIQGITPSQDKTHMALSIGEPKHETSKLINQTLLDHLEGVAKYPSIKGIAELRLVIAKWISKRFGILTKDINEYTQVLPIGGTREALFSFAQAV